MANGWTAERRAQQAELIRTWRPWGQSTGPKTVQGKAESAGNARKHGLRSRDWLEQLRNLKAYVRECRETIR